MQEVRLVKRKYRGGTQKPVQLKTSQALFLKYLWEKFGGVAAVARKVNIEHQNFRNWKVRGYVPLENCGIIARRLNISREGLNWEDHYRFFGYGSDWKTLVKTYKLGEKAEKIILRGEHPKVPKVL